MNNKKTNNSLSKFYKKTKMPRVPGASAEDGMLYYMHKVVPEGADAAKEKYQAGHFIKEFATEKSYSHGMVRCPGAIEQAIKHDKDASHRLNLFAGNDNKNGSSTDDIIDELHRVFQLKH